MTCLCHAPRQGRGERGYDEACVARLLADGQIKAVLPLTGTRFTFYPLNQRVGRWPTDWHELTGSKVRAPSGR